MAVNGRDPDLEGERRGRAPPQMDGPGGGGPGAGNDGGGNGGRVDIPGDQGPGNQGDDVDGGPGNEHPDPVVTEPPPETVPDYSDEADEIRGLGDMDFVVPEVGDAEVPTTSGTADPTMTPWEVTEEQTAMGLGEEYYNRDSPFFEMARQRAIRRHLAGGGQNSAMAAGFGEIAAMDKAFEMAKQDANTYARSAEFNAAMANQYSLAEQRFIQNALLSDQAFQQASALQTQRVEAQLESIVLDYKGRGLLMDKELDQYFLKAKQEYAYQLGLLGAQTNATIRVNSMQAISNFYIAGFQAVMEMANNPNFTPEQSRGAMENGMAHLQQNLQFFISLQGGMQNGGAGGQNTSWLGGYNPATQWAYFPPGGIYPYQQTGG